MTPLLLLAAVTVTAVPSFLAKPGFVTVKASSSNPPWKSYTFGSENLTDGKLSTSWQPKSKKGGVGEWLKVTFNGKAQVEQIVISNGFQHQDELGELFAMNGRIKAAAIKFSPTDVRECRFEENQQGPTVCDIRPERLTSEFTITITEVYKGSKWPDLAVSELDILGYWSQDNAEKKDEPAAASERPHWKEADFIGEWQGPSDSDRYTFRRNKKAYVDGPGGGDIDWFVDDEAQEVRTNGGHDHFRIVSRDELQQVIDGKPIGGPYKRVKKP